MGVSTFGSSVVSQSNFFLFLIIIFNCNFDNLLFVFSKTKFNIYLLYRDSFLFFILFNYILVSWGRKISEQGDRYTAMPKSL